MNSSRVSERNVEVKEEQSLRIICIKNTFERQDILDLNFTTDNDEISLDLNKNLAETHFAIFYTRKKCLKFFIFSSSL